MGSKFAYESLISLGLCVRCRNRRKGPGSTKTRCGKCAEIERQREKNTLDDCRTFGVCRGCRKEIPRPPGGFKKTNTTQARRCPECWEIHRQRQRKWYREKKAAGECLVCGKKHDRGTNRCWECTRHATIIRLKGGEEGINGTEQLQPRT